MAEYWDILDSTGAKTGRLHRRGDPMYAGEYHLSVAVWISDGDGRYLISRRKPEISRGGMWQTTEGGVVAGEDSLTAALREAREELGVALQPEEGTLWRQYTWPHGEDEGMIWYHVWVFRHRIALEDVTLQPEETCDAMWATAEDIRALIAQGIFPPYDYLDELFNGK